MEIDKKRFKKMFPHLAEELETREHQIPITSSRSDLQIGERSSFRGFDTYVPDVIDFIRRCDNEQQAEEIIDYLEKKKEINHSYARKLKEQLREKGVRSFGSKKEEGYYLRQGRL